MTDKKSANCIGVISRKLKGIQLYKGGEWNKLKGKTLTTSSI